MNDKVKTQSGISKRLLPLLAGVGCLSLSVALILPALNSRETSPTQIKPAADKAEQTISFNRDIRPILSDKCFACHGPDAAVAKGAGGFRLDLREGAVVPAEASGKVPIIAGDAENSEVIKRVTSTKPNLVMPPPTAHNAVTDEEVQLLKRWINEGAEYEGHWAYQTPVKPAIPEISEANEKWTKNNIDRFIAYRLEKVGLAPSPQADKTTLIRRVTLDLTGLPPTPEEIDAFVADKSPDAYEKLVERLLASPHFGERLALIWLDAARYGDTNGFHHDNIRTAWPWRQWVIEAFNANMPYDQFIIEQLAGDLLPNATHEQILASGFCRMHNINDEGGALNDEYLVEAIADRIETIGTVMMAQTYTCARCHDHKYDPISQEDYFATWAYFNSVEGERGVYRNNFTAARAYPPFMHYYDDSQREKISELELKLKSIKPEGFEPKQVLNKLDQSLATDNTLTWADTNVAAAKARHVKLTVQEDASVLASGKNPDEATYTITLETKAKNLQAIRLEALRDPSHPEGGLGRANNGNAVLTHIEAKAISTQDPKQSHVIVLAHGYADYMQKGDEFQVSNALQDNELGWAVGSHEKEGNRRAVFVATEPFGYDGDTTIEINLHFKSRHVEHALGRVRLTAGALGEDILTNDVKQYFVNAKQINDIEAQIKSIKDSAVPVLIMKEAAEPVPAYVLERGAYDKPIKDTVIERKPPSMVDLPMPEGAPNNRLGFAQWLVQPEHPLTARVHVNRIWQMLFGTGIVASVEDFGSQAEWPSHPLLLDYLAVDFTESGWDQKALIKRIVTSAAYRQKATRNIEADEVDADNRLLSYFPRTRLKGEFIRDQALAVAGILNDEIGGPSVKPYQPGDLWNEVAIGGTNTGRFKRDSGDALYRRSMYTFWKKTSPPAQMQIFNAPTREFCIVGRDTTNTPLQVLTLWNDEQFLEAARVLAQRTLAQANDDDKRLELIYRRCTGEVPNADELAVLQDVLAYYRERYREAQEDAKTLLTQGEYPLPETHDPAELASWMMVASTALSLDETIVRD
jgi:hypothetical protein